jgi:hypothetical protein
MKSVNKFSLDKVAVESLRPRITAPSKGSHHGTNELPRSINEHGPTVRR